MKKSEDMKKEIAKKKKDQQYQMSLKGIVIGSPGAGKTSLWSTMEPEPKPFESEYSPSFGVGMVSKTYEKVTISGKPNRVKFDLWDTAGRELSQHMVVPYYRGMHLAVYVVDIMAENVESESKGIKDKNKKMDSYCESEPLKVLVANKTDTKQEGKGFSSEQLKKLAQEIGVQEDHIFQCSAKNNKDDKGNSIETMFKGIVELAANHRLKLDSKSQVRVKSTQTEQKPQENSRDFEETKQQTGDIKLAPTETKSEQLKQPAGKIEVKEDQVHVKSPQAKTKAAARSGADAKKLYTFKEIVEEVEKYLEDRRDLKDSKGTKERLSIFGYTYKQKKSLAEDFIKRLTDENFDQTKHSDFIKNASLALKTGVLGSWFKAYKRSMENMSYEAMLSSVQHASWKAAYSKKYNKETGNINRNGGVTSAREIFNFGR